MRENNEPAHATNRSNFVLIPLLPTLVKTKLRNSLKATEDFLHFFPFAWLLSTVSSQPSQHICNLTVTEYFFSLQTHTTGRGFKVHAAVDSIVTAELTLFCASSPRFNTAVNLPSRPMPYSWRGGGCVGDSGGHRYPNNTMHYLPDQTFGRHLHAICSITHVRLWKQMWSLSHILQRFDTRVCRDEESGVCHCHQQCSRWRC